MALSSRGSARPTMGATRARQGRFGRHVLWVLLVGVVLAAIALFGAWMWQSDNLAETEANNARQAADAQAFDAPTPAPIQAQPEPRSRPGPMSPEEASAAQGAADQ